MPLDPPNAWHDYQPTPEVDPPFKCPECGCEHGTVATQPNLTLNGISRVTVTAWFGDCGHNILLNAEEQAPRLSLCPGGRLGRE